MDEAPLPAAPARFETAALGLVVALTLGALALSFRYPLSEYFQPGPGLFPVVTSGLAVLCAAAAFGTALLAGRHAGAAGAPIVWRRLLVYVAVVLFWPMAFAPAGFIISSILGLVLLLRAGEGMGWVPSVGFAVITVGIGWLLFGKLLGVPLP